MVFACRKDGKLRFCVDNRKLNGMTDPVTYPWTPRDECIDSRGEATIFSAIDCNSEYQQTEVPEADRVKTIISSHHKSFRLVRMPFGLNSAPTSLQRAVDIIPSKVKLQFGLVFLDNIIIYSKSATEHFVRVCSVLTAFRNAGVPWKLSRCSLFDGEVSYLGHTVQRERLAVDSSVCEAIRKSLVATKQSELWSFLVLLRVYRRFVPIFARAAAPGDVRTEKNERFKFELNVVWTRSDSSTQRTADILTNSSATPTRTAIHPGHGCVRLANRVCPVSGKTKRG